MLNVEKTYVVHYTRLIERRQRLEGFLRNNNIVAEYIIPFDKDDLTEEQIGEYYLFDKTRCLYKHNVCYKYRP